MKTILKSKSLPFLIAALGGVGLLLRLQLYAAAVDEKNLLIPGHPLEYLLLGLTVAVAVVIVVSVWPLYGSTRYGDNFGPSVPAFIGSVLAGAGIVLTVLLAESQDGYLYQVWKLLGLLSGACLAAAGTCRLRGKQPHFLLHGVVCVFLLLHMICHYQTWSTNPQLQDNLFSLLGCVALAIFAYYQTAFDAGAGKRRSQLAVGLMGAYLSLVSLSGTDAPLLYGGCAIWALTDLCSLTPVRRRPKAAREGE